MPGDAKSLGGEKFTIGDFQTGQNLDKSASNKDAYGNPNIPFNTVGKPPQSVTTNSSRTINSIGK